jgi:type IV secretory pathway TraG/TraD family ATPase VirD4
MRSDPPSTLPGLPQFHPATVIRDWDNGQGFTIADAVTGVAVFGATGSGKTSGTGRHLALGYMGSAAEMGGIVLCAKKDERAQWEQWAREAGRERDLTVFDASGKWCFNFLDWEASHAGEGGGLTINVVALLEEIILALQPEKASAGGENVFWEDALHQLLISTVELVQLAGRELRLASMRDIVRSAPLSREQAKDPAWQEESACWFFLTEAERNTGESAEDVQADYAECRAYWLDDFANLSDRTRSIITLMFTKLAQPFSARPLRRLFSTETNIRPEDTFSGRIIIVDLATQEFRLAGRIAALVWKYCWQVAVMRRPPAPPGQFLRPVFVWADEAAENFLSRGDSAFQAVARASAGCTVYLAQNINQYRKRLGDNDAFESFISNLQNKFFHQVTGPTAKWAADLLGERWEHISGWTSGSSIANTADAAGSQSASATMSEQRRYYVEPARFTTLKRGGVAYGFAVEAVCYKGGHIFSEGKPYTILTFNQKK